MSRAKILALLLLLPLASACGAAAPDPAACPRTDAPVADGHAASADPACPPGCAWDGKICRRTRGVIVPQPPPAQPPSAQPPP